MAVLLDRLRILVADDDAAFAQVVALYLRTCGCTVRTAHGGEPLLDALERETFDVVLTDILMPDLSGIEACARAADRGLQVPFVFMSADCDPNLRFRAEALSHTSVLEKPFPLERLDAFLHDQLQSPKT